MPGLVLGVEFARTRWTRGFRSRNKAAVGEPAAGSLLYNSSVYHTVYCHLFTYLMVFNMSNHVVGVFIKLKRVIVDPLA